MQSNISDRERLLLVEQVQLHHKDVLKEVTDSLNEVVRTQFILANQKEQIEKILEDIAGLLQSISSNTSDIISIKAKIRSIESGLLALKEYVGETPEDTKAHTNYFRWAGLMFIASWGFILAGFFGI